MNRPAAGGSREFRQGAERVGRGLPGATVRAKIPSVARSALSGITGKMAPSGTVDGNVPAGIGEHGEDLARGCGDRPLHLESFRHAPIVALRLPGLHAGKVRREHTVAIGVEPEEYDAVRPRGLQRHRNRRISGHQALVPPERDQRRARAVEQVVQPFRVGAATPGPVQPATGVSEQTSVTVHAGSLARPSSHDGAPPECVYPPLRLVQRLELRD